MKPTLYVILTGGTVGATKPDPKEPTRYIADKLGAGLLVQSLTAAYPNLEQEYYVKVIDSLPLIDSEDISLAYISKHLYGTIFNLSKEIRKGDCIAVAHGTDNIEASATALDLSDGLRELKQKIAIGLWGAMCTPDSDTPDGPYNFANLAKYFSSEGKEAGIFASFSQQIQNALFVRKTHARSIDTFKIPENIFSKIKQNLFNSKVDFIHLHMPLEHEFAQIEVIHPYMQKSEIDNLKQGIKQGKVNGLILENTADITNGNLKYDKNIQELLKFAASKNICITKTHTEYAYYAKNQNTNNDYLETAKDIKILDSYGLSTEKVHIMMAMGLSKVNAYIIKNAGDLEKVYKQRTDSIILPEMHIPKTRINLKYQPSQKKFNIKVIRNHISMYQDMLKAILNDIKNSVNTEKIDGIIIEGPGNGTYNCQLQEIIDNAESKNIPLVISSMCRGYINTVQKEHGVGSSGLVTEDSVKLLNKALSKGLNKQQTHQLFEEYKILN